MAITFQEALDGPLGFVMALVVTFLVTSAFSSTPKKSVRLPSDCVASYDVYLRTALIRFYFVSCMTCAYAIGTYVKLEVSFASAIQAMGVRAQRVARFFVAFTSSGMAVTLAAHVSFIEATIVQTSCFLVPYAGLMDSSYLVIARACITLLVIRFTHLAL